MPTDVLLEAPLRSRPGTGGGSESLLSEGSPRPYWAEPIAGISGGSPQAIPGYRSTLIRGERLLPLDRAADRLGIGYFGIAASQQGLDRVAKVMILNFWSVLIVIDKSVVAEIPI